jgi:hypothetical protein
MAAFRIDPFDAFECRRKHSGWRLSFAKTGAALLSVGIANVTRSHHHGDRDGWQAWRSNVGAFGHASAAPDAHSAADKVTSGCASFVRWWSPPTSENAMTSPSLASCTRRGIGASFANDTWVRDP